MVAIWQGVEQQPGAAGTDVVGGDGLGNGAGCDLNGGVFKDRESQGLKDLGVHVVAGRDLGGELDGAGLAEVVLTLAFALMEVAEVALPESRRLANGAVGANVVAGGIREHGVFFLRSGGVPPSPYLSLK